MASEVEICNLSLALLGDRAAVTAIDPPDGTVQAAHCAQFYPIARNAVLESHAWSFATRREALAELSEDPPGSWDYRYAVPSDCLRVLAVLAEDSEDGDGTEDYILEAAEDGTTSLLTDVENATVRYIRLVTDTARFGPLFVVAAARLLASMLAGPVLKGKTGREEATKQLELYLKVDRPAATAADASAHHPKREHTPDWISDR